MSEDGQPQVDIEREKIALERYKIRLDYKNFVLGSVFVAIAIAAIPPLFQLATAGLEYVKSNADRQTKQQTFRDEYIKEFISNAFNQDIELRIDLHNTSRGFLRSRPGRIGLHISQI